MRRAPTCVICLACAATACGNAIPDATPPKAGAGAANEIRGPEIRGPEIRGPEIRGPEIRSIDWQNRTYDLDGIGQVKVVHGEASFPIPDGGTGSYSIAAPLYADLDGDGIEDAVILSVTSTGGTGHFSQIEIFTIRDHKLSSLGAIPGGDRGDGGIHHVALDGRAVIVERNQLAEGDGVCCASKSQHERWEWKNGTMTEDVTARRTGPARAP
jgi:hypothetical protein